MQALNTQLRNSSNMGLFSVATENPKQVVGTSFILTELFLEESGWHGGHQLRLSPLRPGIESHASHMGCDLSILI